ncbi:EAL and HDOD domain-containing protein [Pleionea sediminis]|uniref:EAL and HDOD domain-containing protein n=1 Tax=Pleionea sediminis TaxID=2569479 RepID=UPI0011863C4A|nr:HDOD domain-containing protein [Pleionea sediminis]
MLQFNEKPNHGSNELTEANESPDILLARQPIFDRNLKLYGYELLYRQNNSANQADFLCGDKATSLLLLNNYASLSQTTEHHRVPAFINTTENLIKSDELLPLQPEKVVLEILENVTPDKALIESICRYKEKGFKIALDDYPFTPEFEPLLKHADFIKVDVLSFPLETIETKLDQLKNFDAQLLAEKVEDHDGYIQCLKLGFHLFQGYFFQKPQIVRGKKLESNKQVIMSILSHVYDTEAQPEIIAEKVSHDAQLSYRLLRIINSAAYGLNRKVQSVKEAVVFLGLNQLKRWIALIAFSASDDTPPELLRTLLIRGRCCELMAKDSKAFTAEMYFTAGLFSGIDSLLGADLNYLIQELPLDTEIQQAILQYKGDIGETLRAVIQFEHAQWDQLPPNIDPQQLNRCYFSAIQWCDEMTASLPP